MRDFYCTQLEYPSKDEVGSIRFHSQPRRWLHVDKSGKLEYRTVRSASIDLSLELQACQPMASEAAKHC